MKKTFDKFRKGNFRNLWIKEPGLSLYVRRFERNDLGTEIDIASVFADEPGNGAFTRFLDKYEAEISFFMENVLNRSFEYYLIKRGYVRHGGCYPYSYHKPKGER